MAGRVTGTGRGCWLVSSAPNNVVLHTYEACDAVERLSYRIDEIAVSDFLTPNYFTIGDAPGTRNDFLGVDQKTIQMVP